MAKNTWVKYLVGVLITISIGAFTTLTTNVIANDEKTRDRESKIINTHTQDMQIVRKELYEVQKENQLAHQEICRVLARIETKVEKL